MLTYKLTYKKLWGELRANYKKMDSVKISTHKSPVSQTAEMPRFPANKLSVAVRRCKVHNYDHFHVYF